MTAHAKQSAWAIVGPNEEIIVPTVSRYERQSWWNLIVSGSSMIESEFQTRIEQLKAMGHTCIPVTIIPEQEAKDGRAGPYIKVRAEWFRQHRPELPDHACAECVPNSELIQPGFKCYYHESIAALSAKGGK